MPGLGAWPESWQAVLWPQAGLRSASPRPGAPWPGPRHACPPPGTGRHRGGWGGGGGKPTLQPPDPPEPEPPSLPSPCRPQQAPAAGGQPLFWAPTASMPPAARRAPVPCSAGPCCQKNTGPRGPIRTCGILPERRHRAGRVGACVHGGGGRSRSGVQARAPRPPGDGARRASTAIGAVCRPRKRPRACNRPDCGPTRSTARLTPADPGPSCPVRLPDRLQRRGSGPSGPGPPGGDGCQASRLPDDHQPPQKLQTRRPHAQNACPSGIRRGPQLLLPQTDGHRPTHIAGDRCGPGDRCCSPAARFRAPTAWLAAQLLAQAHPTAHPWANPGSQAELPAPPPCCRPRLRARALQHDRQRRQARACQTLIMMAR